MSVVMKVRPDRVDAFRGGLSALVAPSRAEAGCMEYHAHQDSADPSVFVMWEVWKDQASLDAHGKMPHFVAFAKAHGADLLAPMIDGVRFHPRLVT